MMKSWADHCSSDEESIDDVEEEVENQELPQGRPGQQREEEEPHEEEPEERVYDFPDKPPFTAFVGNLAFSVLEPEQLKAAITDAAAMRGVEINVIGGRIATDRRENKHRGFGYVEVETLDQLKLLMTLNDGQSMIAGRKIQLDTANQATHGSNNNNHNNNNNDNRRSSRPSFDRRGPEAHGDRRGGPEAHGDRRGGPEAHAKIDGSNFRGGRYSNNDRRSTGGGGEAQPQGGQRAQPSGQRPSLKLAPRTKPREEKPGASQNIFGGAKARDEQAWEKRHKDTKTAPPPHKDTKAAAPHKDTKTAAPHKDTKAAAAPHKDTKAVAPHKDTKDAPHKDTKAVAPHKDTKDGAHNQERRSGRGRGGKGRGGNAGGRGKGDSGRGKGDTNHKRGSNARRNSPQNQVSPEEKAAAAAAAEKVAATAAAAAKPATAPTPAPVKKEVTNKFALLMDSDSD